MGGRVQQPAKSLWRTGLWLDSQLDPQVGEEELWVDDEHNLVLNAQGYSYWLGLVVAPEVVEEMKVFQEDDHQANSCVVSDSAGNRHGSSLLASRSCVRIFRKNCALQLVNFS